MTDKYMPIPPRQMWTADYWEKNHPGFVTRNTSKNARPGEFWWAPNTKLGYGFNYAYQSWWQPLKLLNKTQIAKTAATFFEASRHNEVLWYINKGLAGASPEAISRSRKTSMNPNVYDAVALVMMRTRSEAFHLAEKGPPAMTTAIKEKIDGIHKAMQLIVAMSPRAGTYVNESDYFLDNWQAAYWGENYGKLLEIKNQYDPQGLFYCHHCVGSELWEQGGMSRKVAPSKKAASAN